MEYCGHERRSDALEATTTVASDAVTTSTTLKPAATKVGVWSTEEHERYLQAKYANPTASWKEIARLVGTRSARQVILHDQKFRAKMERRRNKQYEQGQPSHALKHMVAARSQPLYVDSMGVFLLASVASSRMAKADALENGPVEI